MKRLALPAILLAVLAAGVWLLLGRWAPTSSRSSKAAVGARPAATASDRTTSQSSQASIPRFTPATQASTEERGAAEVAGNDTLELHRPLIAAIRTKGLSPADKRAAMLKALLDSGPSQAAWVRRAPDIFLAWQRAMPDLLPSLSLSPPACYRAGCTVEIRFSDAATYRQASARIRGLAEPPGQHGGRVLTPPEQRSGGEVVANWIALAPAGS